METLKRAATSIIVIVLALIVFFPIGFVLLYYRFLMNGGKLRAGGNMCWIGAIFCYIMVAGGIGVILEEQKDYAANIFLIIAFLIGGVALTVLAVKQKKKYKHYKEYLTHMIARRKISIEELAQIMMERTQDVMKNVSEMIQTKMVEGYINEHKEFILTSYAVSEDNHNKVTQNVKVIAAKCESCGATNHCIAGRENRCEYCNSRLNNVK